MSRWTPCKRRDFLRKLRALGFEGPFAGSRHQFLVRGANRLAIPTNEEYSIPQLRMMLRQVETILGRSLPAAEWNDL
ncbi:MAG: type II toxin-antitoxin system HicA family toxin [Thermoanaerobaculia bacterium]